MKHVKVSFNPSGFGAELTRIQPLYVEWGGQPKGSYIPYHQHSFSQLELVVDGSIEVRLKDNVHHLERGDVFLIPPKVEHSFYYRGKSISYISIKFDGTIDFLKRPLLMKSGHESAILQIHLTSLLDHLKKVEHQKILQVQLEAFIKAVFYLAETNQAFDIGRSSRLTDRIRSYIESHQGRRLKVSQITKHFNVSNNYASAIFRDEQNLSIKECIDRQTAEAAGRMLKYSDMRIREISDELQFPDPFSFSRFFKTHHSTSPRAFRKHEKATFDETTRQKGTN